MSRSDGALHRLQVLSPVSQSGPYGDSKCSRWAARVAGISVRQVVTDCCHQAHNAGDYFPFGACEDLQLQLS